VVEKVSDLEDEDKCFAPEMTHQIYGENEVVFGYKDLRINLVMASGSLQTFLSYSYSCKVDPVKTDGVKPDDVIKPLIKILAPGSFTENKDEFIKYLTSTKETGFRPMGELLHNFKTKDDDTFEVYMCTEATPGFREYHERLQSWIMFYIDAASFIDIDDESWRFFLLFKKHGKEGGEQHYSIAGYMTVYEYYAYGRTQNMKRPRISQMLVLAPYQRKGLGAALLNAVYRYYKKETSVVDITVEDPSDNFVRLRDYVDTQNCMKLDAYSKDKVLAGYTDEMTKAAAAELKLCKKQARRVYEIIRLNYTSMNDADAYKSYRLDVKKRLNAPYQKEQAQVEKLKKHLKPEELAAIMLNVTDREQRLEMLNKQFGELEEHYRKVLEKVAAA
jgi:histone acetyltransferase 1